MVQIETSVSLNTKILQKQDYIIESADMTKISHRENEFLDREYERQKYLLQIIINHHILQRGLHDEGHASRSILVFRLSGLVISKLCFLSPRSLLSAAQKMPIEISRIIRRAAFTNMPPRPGLVPKAGSLQSDRALETLSMPCLVHPSIAYWCHYYYQDDCYYYCLDLRFKGTDATYPTTSKWWSSSRS